MEGVKLKHHSIRKEKPKAVPIHLHLLNSNCLDSYNSGDSLFKRRQRITITKTNDLMDIILWELHNRNYNRKTFEVDYSYQKPILIPLSPNYYNQKDVLHWKSLDGFSLTPMKIALNVLQYYNFIQIKKGYWKKSESPVFNPLTQQYDYQDFIDSEMTTVYLNPPEIWKKDLIINKSTEKCYTWKDILYAFCPDISENKWEAVNRRKWIDENGEEHKEDKKAFDFQCKLVKKLNKLFEKAGYRNWSYKRVFGEQNNKLGRFHSSFQMYPKKYRKIILEEEGLCEVDFSASNPNIIYLLETGKEFDGDIYEDFCSKLDVPLEDRPIIKQMLLPMFACALRDGRKGAVSSIRNTLSKNGMYLKAYQANTNIEDYRQELDLQTKEHIEKESGKKNYKYKNYYDNKKYLFNKFLEENKLPLDTKHILINPDYLLDQIELLFPIFKPYLYSACSGLLQNIESKICYATMLNQIALKELPISIHDCFIVSEKNKSIIEYYMRFNRFNVLLTYTKNYIELYKEYYKYIINNKSIQHSIINPIIYTIMKILKDINIENEIAMAPT